MFLNEKIRISKFKMAAAHPLILRKLGKILIKMATVGSKIMLKIQVNAQNDTTDKPFPLVYDKIIYIAINVFKIRKRCILREIWIFFYYISTKIIHVVNSPPCTEQTLHNHFLGSNKSYWIYLSICSLHFMTRLLIFSGQGGTVFS